MVGSEEFCRSCFWTWAPNQMWKNEEWCKSLAYEIYCEEVLILTWNRQVKLINSQSQFLDPNIIIIIIIIIIIDSRLNGGILGYPAGRTQACNVGNWPGSHWASLQPLSCSDRQGPEVSGFRFQDEAERIRGHLLWFTHLNTSAIKGDDFPYSPIFKWGRTERSL